jgi:hypothetical protein
VRAPCKSDRVGDVVCTLANLGGSTENAYGGIGFLADIRRMNVGITRAKYLLLVVGNRSSLEVCGVARLAHDTATMMAIATKRHMC